MIRPIRVAHVIDQLALAGAQRVMLRNIKGLRAPEFAHIVYAVFRDDAMKPELARLGVPFVELGARGARDYPIAIARLWRELRRTRPDIVHTQIFPADVVGRVAGRLAGTPAILSTFHNPIFESTRLERSARIQNLLQVITYRAAHARAIAVSEAVGRSVRACLDDARVTVIPSVIVDLNHWRPIARAERDAARSSLGIEQGAFVFGCVARISVQKGQTYLVEAIARCDPRIHLLLIGDGPIRARVMRRAAELGIADRVRVTGWLPDARAAVAACDALVLSSLWEGYGIALIEGMCSGLPYVATDVGGIPEIARDGVEALLVPPTDVTALAAAIERIRDDQAFSERIATAAMVRARDLARRHDTVKDLASLYRSLVVIPVGSTP